MKRNAFLAGAMFVAAGLFVSGTVLDKVNAANNAVLPFAVINVKKVFDANPKFKAMTDQMKADMEKKENELKAIQQQFQAKQQARQKFTAKADIDAIDKEINDLQFQFNKLQRQYRDELAKMEADIVGSVYGEMSSYLSKLCEQNQIYLVLRLDEPTTDMADDARVMTQMSRQVIYYHGNIDVTQTVIDGLKQMNIASKE